MPVFEDTNAQLDAASNALANADPTDMVASMGAVNLAVSLLPDMSSTETEAAAGEDGEDGVEGPSDEEIAAANAVREDSFECRT